MATSNEAPPNDAPASPPGVSAKPESDPHDEDVAAGAADTAALLGAIAGLAVESAARIAAAALHGLADGISAAAARDATSKTPGAAPPPPDDAVDATPSP